MARRAVFLDRDGVLNRRRWTVPRRPSHLVLLPGVVEALAELSREDWALVIATNQPWVGDGYIARDDHEAIMAKTIGACQSAGATVLAAYACTHGHRQACHDRKPKPGMLTDAARDHDIDLAASWMVGDNAKDMLAGRTAGCRTLLVDPRLRTRLQRAADHADAVARDLPEAVRHILSQAD